MKVVVILVVALGLQACSTLGRTVQGMGEDVKRGTDYVSDLLLPN